MSRPSKSLELNVSKDVDARHNGPVLGPAKPDPSAGHDANLKAALSPYSAVQPPSIERLAPVIWAASSPHRNSASAATCSEVTNSLVGCASSSTSLMTCSLVMLRAFMVSGIWCSTSGVQT